MMEDEEHVTDAAAAAVGDGTVPDLLAPFKQIENTTAWVAARG